MSAFLLPSRLPVIPSYLTSASASLRKRGQVAVVARGQHDQAVVAGREVGRDAEVALELAALVAHRHAEQHALAALLGGERDLDPQPGHAFAAGVAHVAAERQLVAAFDLVAAL